VSIAGSIKCWLGHHEWGPWRELRGYYYYPGPEVVVGMGHECLRCRIFQAQELQSWKRQEEEE
jgi:hypothetical protein